jgi:glyoxylase-like metal-dependent hydrolase (beta-lactamase superfamily II)
MTASTTSITCVTAPNRGPMTGDGTNTWLVGRERLAVIDPGPDDPTHRDAILAAAAGRPITHILATHAHRDHVDGLAPLRAATGAVTAGFGRDPADPRREAIRARTASGRESIDWEMALDITLHDGTTIAAGDVTLDALHTPGHAPDHLCFALVGTDVLFTGDHVMSWNTSIIAPPEGHMGAYLASLERLLARPEVRYLPGHGPDIADGHRTAKAYLVHRQMRERAVVDAIRAGHDTSLAIAEQVYAGLDRAIWPAAVLSVQAHVELLREKGLVHYPGVLTPGQRLVLSGT